MEERGETMSVGWVKCLVTDGMFEDERLVTITNAAGEEISCSVPQVMVDNGHVYVEILEQNRDHMLVALPTADQLVIKVKRNL
jgi:hypothetical protein